jgi:hypothetical protein
MRVFLLVAFFSENYSQEIWFIYIPLGMANINKVPSEKVLAGTLILIAIPGGT